MRTRRGGAVTPSRAVVLVTGATSGIGRAAVQRLAKAGCQVVATARRLESIADLAGPDVVTLRLDVASASDRAVAVDSVLARHGRIDGLVNNAGFGATLAVEDTPAEAMQAIF